MYMCFSKAKLSPKDFPKLTFGFGGTSENPEAMFEIEVGEVQCSECICPSQMPFKITELNFFTRIVCGMLLLLLLLLLQPEEYVDCTQHTYRKTTLTICKPRLKRHVDSHVSAHSHAVTASRSDFFCLLALSPLLLSFSPSLLLSFLSFSSCFSLTPDPTPSASSVAGPKFLDLWRLLHS